MSEQRQRVRNAADREQVEKARKQDARDSNRYMLALHNTLNTLDGRIVITQFLRAAGIGVGERNTRVFDNSGSVTAFNAGQHELGSDLQEACRHASLKFYQIMESEARDVIETEQLENQNG